MPVYFHKEDVSFRLNQQARLKDWIKRVIISEEGKPGDINFIFCSDKYLLNLNKKYLRHDYYTDIITFSQSNEHGVIAGDIFISIDRVEENARGLRLSMNDELHRVMIHGVLHLLGYDDKTKNTQAEMRAKETDCLLQLRKADK